MQRSYRRIFGALLVLLLAPSLASATQTEGVEFGPVAYVAAGLIIVDVGISLGNGIALAQDRPDRLNGQLGIVTGVLSLGFVAASCLSTEDSAYRDDFALVMGTAGLSSLLLGLCTVRAAGDRPGELSFAPLLMRDGSDLRWGLGLTRSF